MRNRTAVLVIWALALGALRTTTAQAKCPAGEREAHLERAIVVTSLGSRLLSAETPLDAAGNLKALGMGAAAAEEFQRQYERVHQHAKGVRAELRSQRDRRLGSIAQDMASTLTGSGPLLRPREQDAVIGRLEADVERIGRGFNEALSEILTLSGLDPSALARSLGLTTTKCVFVGGGGNWF